MKEVKCIKSRGRGSSSTEKMKKQTLSAAEKKKKHEALINFHAGRTD
jgi:hypothetical protein